MTLDVLISVVVRARNAWFGLREGESGQTLIEYALIVALVSVACILAIGFFTGAIQDLFSKAGSSLG
jgi:Flp pilus assembly pilin Flp